MAYSVFNYMTDFYGKTGEALVGRGALTNFANFALGNLTGLTALAGGAQSGATVLGYHANQVDTVASANDSVQLPLAVPGADCLVNNSGAQTMRIYANIGANANNGGAVDQILANATTTKTANGTAITLASGTALMFMCFTPGVWKQVAAAS